MRWLLASGLLMGCVTDDPVTDPTDVEDGVWRSALYPADWTPEFTGPDGRFVHDMSYAGYRRSEVPLPVVEGPVFDVVERGADPTGAADSTASIQAAIDAAQVSGGVVWLPEGLYRVDGTLQVQASGVVIRGAGAQATKVAFTKVDGMTDRAHLTFRGSLVVGEPLPLTSDAVSRSHTLSIASTDGLTVGDDVVVGWTISEAFVEEHAMTGTWQAFNGTWRPFFQRELVAVNGELTVDVPLRYDAKIRDDAAVKRISGYLTEVGLEDLSVSTEAPWSKAWANDRNHAIDFVGVKDAWVRGVGTFDSPFEDDIRERHLQSGGVRVLDSKRVTIADSMLQKAQNRGGGGNGYLFEISRSSEVLVRDCEGHTGRHNFIQNWDFGTSGLVFLRTTSTDGKALNSASSGIGSVGLSEFHHSLAMANLIDNSVADDGWGAVNRQDWSSGAGHSATQSVFWNTSGQGELRSFQFGHGYVIGTRDISVLTSLDTPTPFNSTEGTAPEDWVEGLEEGASLVPESLFEDQLRRRLAR